MMEPTARDLLRRAFNHAATRYRAESPVGEALLRGLGAAPSPGITDLYGRYLRIILVSNPDPLPLLAALHEIALAGQAETLARFFPSCGGSYDPAVDEPGLVTAAEALLRESGDDLLDFMLAQEPRMPEVNHATTALLGALATVDRFGGGLALVELGAGGGLSLDFDRYAYRIGPHRLGHGPVLLEADLEGEAEPVGHLLAGGMPSVISRYGLDVNPQDLRRPDALRVALAWCWPDQTERLDRLRSAAALQAEHGRPDLREGAPEHHLAALLVEAYNEMAPGNTLFLYHIGHWYGLSEEQRRATALAVQRLAAQLKPHKPMAWLQVEPFTPGSPNLELRLQTFGWTDQEDRAVRRLAEADPAVTVIRWVE